MNYDIIRIECGMYQENAYLLCPEEGNKALLIDPGDDLNRIKRYLAESGKVAGEMNYETGGRPCMRYKLTIDT